MSGNEAAGNQQNLGSTNPRVSDVRYILRCKNEMSFAIPILGLEGGQCFGFACLLYLLDLTHLYKFQHRYNIPSSASDTLVYRSNTSKRKTNIRILVLLSSIARNCVISQSTKKKQFVPYCCSIKLVHEEYALSSLNFTILRPLTLQFHQFDFSLY